MLIKLVQPPQQEGYPSQEITAVINNITMTVKQPLEPVFAVIMGDITLPCIGNYFDFLDTVKEKGGFHVFETPEGGKVSINPSKILTFTSPQIGLYSVMMGRAGAVIKATSAEIEAMFNTKPSILT